LTITIYHYVTFDRQAPGVDIASCHQVFVVEIDGSTGRDDDISLSINNDGVPTGDGSTGTNIAHYIQCLRWICRPDTDSAITGGSDQIDCCLVWEALFIRIDDA
jgi:hypothetical protein